MAGSTAALAQPREVVQARLGWESASSACIGGAAVGEAVDAILGRAALTTGRADLLVMVHVAPHGGGHRAHVELRSESRGVLGERNLEDDDPECRALSEGLPLALALMIDLEQQRASTLRVGAARARAAVRQWHLALHIGAGADFGRMPVPGPLVHARAALTPPGSPVALVLRFAAMLPIESVGGSGAGMRAWSVGGALGASVELVRAGVVRVALEASFESALLDAAGVGLQELGAARRWSGAAVVGGLVGFRLGKTLEIGLDLALGAPVIHRRFVFTTPDGSDALVYEPLPVFGRVGVLLGLVTP